MTKIFKNVGHWHKFRDHELFHNKTIGLVPTMGNLHLGHESLLQRAVAENDISVLTIFVNPTQFNDPSDLENYPRSLDSDISLAFKIGVNYILIPENSAMYPDNYRYKVKENEFSRQLCGQFRPGHFDGMLTVVLKLLLMTRPTRAYFGEKDFQQLQLVSDMVNAFFINISIVACPTIRDKNGLALSSRNKLLLPQHYLVAPQFAKLLASKQSLEEIKTKLSQCGFIVEYIEEQENRRYGAVRLGGVRLIDNVAMGECYVNNNA